jgi:hypothetical protein
MRSVPRFIVLATLAPLVCMLALACKRAGSSKLEGRWHGTRAEGVTPDVEVQANAFAMGTEIVARGNQIAVTTPAGRPQQSTYYVDAEDKLSVVIHTDKDGPGTRETFTFSEDGRTMTWRLDEHRTITFQRLAN